MASLSFTQKNVDWKQLVETEYFIISKEKEMEAELAWNQNL